MSEESTAGIVRFGGNVLITRDGRLFEVKKLAKTGGSHVLIVPNPWIAFFGMSIGEEVWVKWSVELGRITLSPLDEAEREALKAHLQTATKEGSSE